MKYDDHGGIIHKLSWDWHRRTGLDLEELKAEALCAFAKVARTYNGTSEESTWVWFLVDRELGGWAAKEMRHRRPINAEGCNEDQEGLPDGGPWLVDLLASIGKEAREVVETVFKAPAELAEFMPTKRERGLTMATLGRYFRRKKGWSGCQCDRAFAEIKEAL